jgi:hypothetical protein
MRIIVITAILLNVHFGLLAQNEPTLDIAPNPFVDTTSFVFTLPISDTVSLVVYDRWGQLIDTPVNEQLMPQGTHSVIFIGDTIPYPYAVENIEIPIISPVNSVKNELDNYVNFEVYPNPTIGQINVTGLTQETTRVVVYNVLGELVYDDRLIDNQLDLSSLSSGAYILHVTQRKTTFRKKVIKL